jgi:hypothetical protein
MKGKPLWIVIAAAVGLVVLVGVLILVFQRKPTAPTPPAKVVAVQPVAPAAPPAPAPVPFSYQSKTAGIETSLKLPPSLLTAPELHQRIYDEGVADLKRFARDSVAARAEDSEDTTPYQRTVKWTTATETDKLISLEKQTFEFSGGAHGNVGLDAVLWDKALKRTLQPSALFKPNTDYARLDALLCQAVNDAKKAREGDGFEPATSAPGAFWQCPHWRNSVVVLAPSNQPGKAGGLTFLFAPYAVSSFAEGDFMITIPLSDFQPYLAPAYADQFGGRPPKVGDVTPQ